MSFSSRLLKLLQSAAQKTAITVQDAAFEISAETRENLRTGFGIPRAVGDAASFSCFAIAAAGTASVTFDLVGKVFGSRDCLGCSGWEAVSCQTCRGTGRVRSATPPSGNKILIAAPVLGHPSLAATSSSLPCPTCSGSGVMKCPECKGDSWKPRFTLDKIMDSPRRGWAVHQHCKPVLPSSSMLSSPSAAEFWLFDLPEAESGKTIPAREKGNMWWQYSYSQRYNDAKAIVANRKPGWEAANQTLLEIDAKKAMEEGDLVEDVEREKRRLAIIASLATQPPSVPKRPSNFGVFKNILEAPEWNDVKSEEARKMWETILKKQEEFKQAVLDAQWKEHWLQNLIEERTEKAVPAKAVEKKDPKGGSIAKKKTARK